MKYKHSITFNNIDENECSKYSYNFGKTKIEIIISKTGVSISADLDKYYNADTILDSDQYLFADGIKKIFFIYLLKYSVNLDVKSVIIKIYDKEEVLNFNDEGNTPVHSLIFGNLSEKLPDTFSNDKIIEHILNTTKSDGDQRVSITLQNVPKKIKHKRILQYAYYYINKLNIMLASKGV